MAVLGVGAIGAVLIGLQCGGLGQCFTGKPPAVAATVAPAAPASATTSLPAPVEASLSPAAPAEAADTQAPATVAVAMSKPEVPEGVKRAQRVDQMIGNTFVALASDDEGWLRGAAANAANDPETYAEGDGAGPPATGDETAVEAADAVAGEADKPLERPTPLDVTAFAEAPAETAASVKADAERKLAAVAKSEPEPITEPEAQPEAQAAAEPEPTPEPEPAKAEAAASGDSRTVAGSGVNVRSGPGKSNGRVFGLAGGEKVTVSENRRGWLKITDDQGRTGWVYKDYLN